MGGGAGARGKYQGVGGAWDPVERNGGIVSISYILEVDGAWAGHGEFAKWGFGVFVFCPWNSCVFVLFFTLFCLLCLCCFTLFPLLAFAVGHRD